LFTPYKQHQHILKEAKHFLDSTVQLQSIFGVTLNILAEAANGCWGFLEIDA